MKRIFALIVTVMLIVGSVCAYAEPPSGGPGGGQPPQGGPGGEPPQGGPGGEMGNPPDGMGGPGGSNAPSHWEAIIR